ncbi:MAG: hypothetical protein ACK46X_08045 [Candidatus Sericytochromatia bacterium]
MLESKARRLGWRDLLSRENLVAVATVATGSVCGMAGGALLVQAPDNYAHSGFLDGMIEALLAAAAMFGVGAYVAAALPRAIAPRDPDYVPALVALGAFLGVALGSAASGPLLLVLGPLSTVVAVSVAVVVTRFAMRARKPPSPVAWRRWVGMPIVAAAGLAAAISVASPGTDFPGAEAPIPVRRDWAVKTFGEAYTKAEAYLRAAPAVRERLGAVEAIAPTEGENRTAMAPGELMGDFTLEVTGTRGTGVARLRFMHGSSDTDVKSYGFSGTLTTPAGTVELPPLN